MYRLVNMITCEMIDPESLNSVFGLFMGRAQMSPYLGHLELLSRWLRSTQFVNMITCEITDPASPVVFG